MSTSAPRTVDEIFADYNNRRQGLLRALTTDVEELYRLADPDRDNLCLYGLRDGTWTLDLPADEVPAELPEPCLGINFARDGMEKGDWISLVAVHSDSWLMSVAFFYAVKLDAMGRSRLFALINRLPTLFETVSPNAKQRGQQAQSFGPAAKKKRLDRPTEAKYPSGKPLLLEELTPSLRGRQAELFWPDNALWYLVEVQSVNTKSKQAKILYATGEEEDLDLEEIIRDGHIRLLPL